MTPKAIMDAETMNRTVADVLLKMACEVERGDLDIDIAATHEDPVMNKFPDVPEFPRGFELRLHFRRLKR